MAVAPTEHLSSPDPLSDPLDPLVGGDDDLPSPKKVEAEIHGVDFSGHTGFISKSGGVTVVTALFVEEETQPKDTERSL